MTDSPEENPIYREAQAGVEASHIQSSMERIEDLTFQTLIQRWTEQRKFDQVVAANIMYGYILLEREGVDP